jgi:protein-S-isoprenylcysteine O-methyltransferase Ste14
MDEVNRLGIGLWNGWIFYLPLLLVGIAVPLLKPAAAKRMADMTGYTPREKLATVVASLLPHGFFGLSAFVPLGLHSALFSLGLMIYLVALAGFGSAVATYAGAPIDELVVGGLYRWSRNPMYFFASLILLGIALMCASLLLLVVLAVMLGFQHVMILAEERTSASRYGEPYRAYLAQAARYFLFF